MHIVMDADCLIKLTKAGLKEQVCRAFTISIPSLVRTEVVDHGRQHPESAVVSRNIEQGLIREQRGPQVEKGEEAALALFSEGCFAANEHVEDAVAIRKLIQTGAETYVARLYEQGRITLREAAARLGTDLTGALDLMVEHGVRGNLRAADVLASVDQMS